MAIGITSRTPPRKGDKAFATPLVRETMHWVSDTFFAQFLTLDLGQKAIGSEYRAEFRLEDLEGDLSLVPDIAREVDRRHAAGTELAQDLVASSQHIVQLREDVQLAPGRCSAKLRLTRLCSQ